MVVQIKNMWARVDVISLWFNNLLVGDSDVTEKEHGRILLSVTLVFLIYSRYNMYQAKLASFFNLKRKKKKDIYTCINMQIYVNNKVNKRRIYKNKNISIYRNNEKNKKINRLQFKESCKQIIHQLSFCNTKVRSPVL